MNGTQQKKMVTVNFPSRLTHTVRAVNTNPPLKFKREFTTVLFSTATRLQAAQIPTVRFTDL